jgi:transcriptional regulator with XRE-family HTH domain
MAIVGANLRRLRMQRGLSLQRLALLAGVSRAMLGQVELGKSLPSIQIVWKIARALEVSLVTLLTPSERVQRRVFRKDQTLYFSNADGTFQKRALSATDEARRVEFYEAWLAPRARERVPPHRAGSRISIVVGCGAVELTTGESSVQLQAGDAVSFDADVPHVYANHGDVECQLYLVLIHAHEIT